MAELNDAVIKQLLADIKEIKEQQILLRIDVARLNIKSGIWGMIGGGITTSCALLIYMAKSSIGK